MTDRPSDDPTDGRLVASRYRLLRSLGQGGMGVVWAGRDELLDRDVAVKEVTPPPGLGSHQRERLRERTLREARAAARISSNAAVTVYDVVEEDGRPWIVMELLPARTLADVLREEGPMGEQEAARLGLRLLEALTAAHRAGVLHRDVKPANVLYDATGHAVLTDFGIASLEGDSSMTTTGTIIGSPGYVAPERAHGQPPSAASDLWSLGVTLAAAVSGRSPFERETPLATMLAAVQEPLPEPIVQGPLGAVVERLLRKDPADRPDADEVRRMLAQVGDGAPVTSTGTTPRTRPMPVVAPQADPRPGSPDAERTQALPLAPAVPVPGPAPARAPDPSRAPATSHAPGPARAPAPAPGRPVEQGRRRGALPVMLTVLLLVVAAGVALAVLLDGDGTPGTAAGADPTSSVDTTAGPTGEPEEGSGEQEQPTGDPEPPADEAEEPEAAEQEPEAAPEAPAPDAAAPVVPDGFEVHEDPGYRVAVPAGWTVEPDGETRTRFLDPDSRRYLLVEEGGEPAGDPVEDWQAQEQSVSQRLDGYELIGIEAADFRGFDTADWQFTWEPGGGTVRVLNRAVVDEDLNRAYALYWSVPVEEWDAGVEVFQGIAGSFEPLG
jgi:eukaryotic-like serine/threonine-protein kinase